MHVIDQVRRFFTTQSVLTLIQEIGVTSESADYRAWRKQFMRDRLQLAALVALCSHLSFVVLSQLYYFSIHPYRTILLLRDVAVPICLIACLALRNTAMGHRRPDLLFLGICWSSTLFTQIAAFIEVRSQTSLTSFEPSILLWTLTFLTLAASIPVQWRLHAIAQLGVVGLHVGLTTLPGVGSDLRLSQQIWVYLFQLWICFICDLGVYLYDRLKRRQFEARYRLNAFVKTVSYDLRTPVLSTLAMLRQLLNQPGETLTIARSTLESMLDSSDRQLALIEALLDKARSNLHPKRSRFANSSFLNEVKLASLCQTASDKLQHLGNQLGAVKFTPVAIAKPNLTSSDYEQWRHDFIIHRLRLVWWVALGGAATLFIPDWYGAFWIDPSGQYWLYLYAAIVLYLALWAMLYRSRWGRSHLSFLFISFACSIPLITQVFTANLGITAPDMLVWTIIALMMAILLPVCWTLHVASQGCILVGYFVINACFGLNPAHQPALGWVGTAWYLFWIYFISDLAVYTYERLQHDEFESTRHLRTFLHSVAHDLKTPVMGMAMILRNMLNQSQETLSLSRCMVERMIQGGDRQLRLINSLLEAHSSPAHGIVCHYEPTNLNTLIQTILTEVNPLLVRSQAQLHNKVSPHLPTVDVDPSLLWRVFENLITNALKYNPPGVHLTIQAVAEQDVVRFSIQDNGIGIKPDLCKRIFELYCRGSHVRRSPGLGLGLYLCSQIIKAHGGDIGVVSTPGVGSTFWFTLPLSPARSLRSVNDVGTIDNFFENRRT